METALRPENDHQIQQNWRVQKVVLSCSEGRARQNPHSLSGIGGVQKVLLNIDIVKLNFYVDSFICVCVVFRGSRPPNCCTILTKTFPIDWKILEIFWDVGNL